jgi:hypothetical protein
MRQLSIISHDVGNPVASKPNEKTDEFENGKYFFYEINPWTSEPMD